MKASQHLKHDPSVEARTYDVAFYQKPSWAKQVANGDCVANEICDFFLRSFEPFDSIVDLGCGDGVILSKLAGAGKDVLGVDLSDGAVAVNQLGDRFRRADLGQPLDLGRTFDVCMSVEVWEHLVPEVEATFLANIRATQATWLFVSCARPGQRGRHHYNPQEWHEWIPKVIALGYEPDLVRCLEWDDIHNLSDCWRWNPKVFKKRSMIDVG
jgi:cyclopropane fatty-acyl-phospholipid synthase-like methyltransferase